MIGTPEQITDYLKDKTGIFELKQKREKSLRSIFQNKYYFWVIVSTISDFHWYSPCEAHNLIKLTVWLETTTDLSTKDFAFMCDLIRDTWNTQFGVYIPKPNEVEDLKVLEKYYFND